MGVADAGGEVVLGPAGGFTELEEVLTEAGGGHVDRCTTTLVMSQPLTSDDNRRTVWDVKRTLLPVALVLVLGACASEATDVTTDPKSTRPETTTTELSDVTTTEPPTTTTTVPATTTTTAPPEDPQVTNARRSAQSYLDLMGFSRQGLIDQLSSEYGDQYPVDVATAAVDSLDVDWNAEAVEAAESYLEISGFSHAGLVDQLSSAYGDQFTREQAEHGATVALGG